MSMKYSLPTYQGVIVDHREAMPSVADAPTLKAPQDVRFHEWDEWLTPVDDQGKWGTCVAQRDTRLIETMLHRHLGVYVQLDALAVYRRAWEIDNGKPWPGDAGYETGLRPHKGIEALIDLGVLPFHAEFKYIANDEASIRAALVETPVLAATCVHEGWMQKNIDPDTGELAARQFVMNGHAWILHALDVGSTGRVLVGGVNSWGTDWGWRGFFYWLHWNFVSCCLVHPAVVAGVDWNSELRGRRAAWERLVIASA